MPSELNICFFLLNIFEIYSFIYVSDILESHIVTLCPIGLVRGKITKCHKNIRSLFREGKCKKKNSIFLFHLFVKRGGKTKQKNKNFLGNKGLIKFRTKTRINI